MKNPRGLVFHLIFISVFFVATSYVCSGVRNISAVCFEKERLALLKFKHSVKDDFKMLSSWVGDDCCRWERIQCDAVTGNVISLHLRADPPFIYYSESEGRYLVGNELDSSLSELKHLKYLDLSGNRFGGSKIPEFIGSLKQLMYLNLSHVDFFGIVPPHIGNLTNIKVLDLSINYELRIDDVAWIFHLSSLEHLELSLVDLSGTQNWDMLLYMIPSLRKISLSECGLPIANICPFLNSSRVLPNIEHLDLGFNSFKGALPRFLHNMTSLTFLDLSNYNVSLAWNFANLINTTPSLTKLHLSSCDLDKTFLSPPHLNFSTLSNIQHLDLSYNSIEGMFPSLLTNMSSLRVLDLYGNMLNSSVPFMPSLLKLDLSYNQIKQIEHVGIWRHCHLKEFSASYNLFPVEITDSSKNVSECSQYDLERLDLSGSLYGTIPEALGRLVNLRGIYLSESELRGSIPESLGKLIFLQVLYLSSNQITGSIPESLGKLRFSQVLDLSFNQITGQIPVSLGRLRFLEVLDLSYNQITGPIPTFIGKLSKLDLSLNQLNGSIPESFGKLAALTNLNLENNRLTGPIPTSVGRLRSLQTFCVHSNLLNGTIPVSIGQLSKLYTLRIDNNSLEGVVFEAHFANHSMLEDLETSTNTKLTFNVSHEWVPPFQLVNLQLSSCNLGNRFPRWLRNQKKLKMLGLSNTRILGPLPRWLQKMSFSSLDLSHNQLRGSLTNLPIGNGTETLFLQNNRFSESIPSSLCTLTSMLFLDLSRNRLTGELPKCLVNLRSLITMRFSSNRLYGHIPSSIALTSLEHLNLNDNNFIGEIPRKLGNLQYLSVLDLGDNKLSGDILEWIGENLTTLIILRLHKNNFTGRIPSSLCKASHLQVMDIAYNNLTGTIPRCLGELKAMAKPISIPFSNSSTVYVERLKQAMKGVDIEYTTTWELVYNMDLSSNNLVGKIPVELTALSMLLGLNLSNNHLSGVIPDSIGNMTQLFSLDFSNNKLIGMIPQSMAALNFLSHLNLSHNSLLGPIPTGSQLQTLTDPSIYDGNKDLCGAPLSKNCSNHRDQATMPKKTYKAADAWSKVWLFYLDIICGFAIGFWGIIGVLLLKKQWRMKLFMFVEETMDKIYVAVVVRVAKMKRGREAV